MARDRLAAGSTTQRSERTGRQAETPVARTGSRTTLRLNVPAQKLDALTFADARPDAIKAWVLELPLANPAEASRQLYRAIGEINRLRTSMVERHSMLESLRAPIYHMCGTLSRSLSNQPAILPANLQRVADYAQALQNQLAVGFKVVVADGLRNRVDLRDSGSADTHVVVESCHRAITDLTRTLLRACQLYAAAPQRLWSDLHQLYLLAERFGRIDDAVVDPVDEERASTISQAYRRALLLACARPNKLRQRDLAQLFTQLAAWVPFTHIRDDAGSGTFVFDLASDTAPRYTTLVPSADGPSWRSLDTRPLIAALDALLDQRPTDLPVAERTSAHLLQHALLAFGEQTRRSFARTASDGLLHVCVGITNVHFHLADEHEFDEILRQTSNASIADDYINPFLRPTVEKEDDVWSNAFDVGGARMAENPDILNPEALLGRTAEHTRRLDYPEYAVRIVDTSPGGYCVRWSGVSVSHLQTGELVVLREDGERQWSIAVIRWIRTTADKVTLVGIELLGPRAIPVGARIIQTKGGPTDYMRALLMPAIEAIGQPALLITPTIPFHEGHKIFVNHLGTESKAILSRRIACTESFNQFEFRFLDPSPLDQQAAGH